ncbi:hypothetical protein ACFSC6_19800 [Rufibacter sediminis]|uniref:Uncharacterized protein n=1 Tax=Rufibacter sediminis TaxID=2762756 RepID=A0ABR6VNH4_9BACT|nr:hypothetical protein [Rufibacter sediminis]MBC3538693.1 hypothetical protein [Rufibacter sediminis]
MHKVFLKYLLSLSILLLSGYSPLYAHAPKESLYHASPRNMQKNVQAAIGAVQKDLSHLITYSSAVAEKAHNDRYLAEAETEEDKPLLKKTQENSTYLTAVFYAQALAFLLFFLKKNLTYYKDFFSFPAQRLYILFRVFRI